MRSRSDQAIEEILRQGWIQHVSWQSEVDSTNDVARRSLSDLDRGEIPMLVVADRQSAGRGRSQNRWWSPGGCLMFTLVLGEEALRPDPNDWPQLALVVGVACARAAESVADKSAIQLKWPNDLYIAGRKCGGILIESVSCVREGKKHQRWLIGVGMNVSVDFETAPEDVRCKATSLHEHSLVRNLQLPDVLVEVCRCLEEEVKLWREASDDWLNHWRDHCLLTGKMVRIESPQSEYVEGQCEGVDASGVLLVRTASGLRAINAGEILDWT